MRKTYVALIAVLAVLAIGVGSATAGSLITSKQIKDHTIKVKDLRKNAVKKLRGQTGPAGATGATGAAGKAGDKGATGATGPVGVQGPSGSVGAVGPAGAVGPSGAVGPAGVDGKDGADSTVAGPQGETGLAGPQGEVGPQGPQGPVGPSGAAGSLTQGTSTALSLSTEGTNVTAHCPPGTKVFSGGFSATQTNDVPFKILESAPTATFDGWTVRASTSKAGTTTLQVYAVCAA